MKQTLKAKVLLIGFVAGVLGYAIGQGNFRPRPRFEHVMTERTPDGEDSYVGRFDVWHDKETGQEIVCVVSVHSNLANTIPLSCYPTGRTWK